MPGRILILVLVMIVAGCAQGPRAAGPVATMPPIAGAPAALVNCCSKPPPYPHWLIRAVEPTAPLIGRAIALVQFRRGYLDARKDAQVEVLSHLKPLDIVLVGSKGRLTGNMLPGALTHTAIYLGTERELRDAGAWTQAEVAKHHEAIRSGKVFIEADHLGVHLSSARVVLNADRVLILRPRPGSASCRRRTLKRYYDHVGVRYDYRFNAGETSRLFCAELVHHAHPELDLPLTRLYGRATLIPDAIAAMGLSRNSRLSFVAYVRGRGDGWDRLGPAEALADIADAWKE